MPQQQSEKIDYPWLLFRLQNTYFAINSRRVTSIMIYPEDITQIPESPDFVRGLIMLRGSIVRLLDLRLLLSMESTDAQLQNISYMLDARKQDHLNWVAELERCVECGEDFCLATDPHKCAFGQWYDAYQSDQPQVMHHLRKIEEPHRRLHETALLWDKLVREEGEQAKELFAEALDELKNQIAPKMDMLLEETKKLFQDNIREMVIVIEENDRRLGLIVDQVLSVETLSTEELDDSGVNFFHDLTYVKGICKSKSVEGNILVLNDDELLTLTAGDGNLEEVHVTSVQE